MPRGVYERKKTNFTPPPHKTERVARVDKKEIGLLALRGYLATIRLSGDVPQPVDIERIGRIVDEALDEGNEYGTTEESTADRTDS